MKRLIKTRDEREQIAKLARHERRLFRTKYQQLLQTMQLRLDTDYQTGLIAALDRLKAIQGMKSSCIS